MKKAFTLVEVMVVIVILGVLAAVGVPKMFGVIAKAKAAEVPVAAGTYISLQNAYLTENNGIGSWQNIGYGAPDNGRSEYFEYNGCINGTIPFESMEPDMPGWMASNLSNLNSCKRGSFWSIVIDPAGEREIEYRHIVSSVDCAALTINWNVGDMVEGMCESTGELHLAKNDEPEEVPESSAAEEESSSSVAGSSPASSSTAQSSSQQGDCDALAKSIKNDNGNKYGWICISECGMFAPPGKAKNAGFTGNYEKKKNSGTCEKASSDQPGSSASQSGNSSSSANGTQQSSGGTSVAGGSSSSTAGTGYSTGGTPGQGGTGGGTGGTSSQAVTSSASITSAAGGNSSSSQSGYVGLGEPHDYNESIDFCFEEQNNKGTKTCVKWRPKDECTNWKNKNKCDSWKKSN